MGPGNSMGMGMGSGMGGNCSSGQTGMQQFGRNQAQSASNVPIPYYYSPLTIPQSNTYTPPAATVTPVNYTPAAYVFPTPPAKPESSASTSPVEAPNRMLFVELSVKGMDKPGDRNRLATALDKLDGSRGASVKRK
jgi:hypothetical protein